MRPTIAPGALLTIDPTASVRVGDVVAFLAADGSTQAHRVVAVAGERLVTRGDAAPWPDPPITRHQLLGLVKRGGAAGAASARWPALAPLLGALGRVRQFGDVPAATGALVGALAIRLARTLR